MTKGEIVIYADDDDEVRTSASQNCVTATLCTWILPHDSVYIALHPYKQGGVRWKAGYID